MSRGGSFLWLSAPVALVAGVLVVSEASRGPETDADGWMIAGRGGSAAPDAAATTGIRAHPAEARTREAPVTWWPAFMGATPVAAQEDATGFRDTRRLSHSSFPPTFSRIVINPKDGAKFEGHGPPGGTVRLQIDGEKLGEAVVDADGRWMMSVERPFAAGDHRISAEAGAEDPLQVIAGQDVRVAIPENATAEEFIAYERPEPSLRERAEDLARAANERFSELTRASRDAARPAGDGVAGSEPRVAQGRPERQASPGEAPGEETVAATPGIIDGVRSWLSRSARDYADVVIPGLAEPRKAAPAEDVQERTASATEAVEPPQRAPETLPGGQSGSSLRTAQDWLREANRVYQDGIVGQLSRGDGRPVGEQPDTAARRVEDARQDEEQALARAAERRQEAERLAARQQEAYEEQEAERRAREALEAEARRREDEQRAEQQRTAEEQRLAIARERAEAERARAEEERRRLEDEARLREAAEEERRRLEEQREIEQRARQAALAAQAERDAAAAAEAARMEADRRAEAERDRLIARKVERADEIAALEREWRAADDSRRQAEARALQELLAQREREAAEAADLAETERLAAEARAAAEEARRLAAELAEARSQERQQGAEKETARRPLEPDDPSSAAAAAPPPAPPERMPPAGPGRIQVVQVDRADREGRADVIEQGSGLYGPVDAPPRRRARRTETSWACRDPRAGRTISLPGTYVVQLGDSLWSIAERHYDNGSRYRLIRQANRKKIRHPRWIYPCQRFWLPKRPRGG